MIIMVKDMKFAFFRDRYYGLTILDEPLVNLRALRKVYELLPMVITHEYLHALIYEECGLPSEGNFTLEREEEIVLSMEYMDW
jgi:hypothetical protein